MLRRVFEHLLELCTGLSKDDIAQPVFAGLAAMDYPELHDESIPALAFYRACARMMDVCGVVDFSIRDVLAPQPKRLRRHLSAVVNFAKFREERLVMYVEPQCCCCCCCCEPAAAAAPAPPPLLPAPPPPHSSSPVF